MERLDRLSEYSFRSSYDSGEDDLIADFYVPAMSCSVSYARAVGYFSSSALAAASKGVYAFVRNGGSMRLLASPYLESGDVEAIDAGITSRESLIENAIERSLLVEELSKIGRDRFRVLAWLLHRNLLDVKLAVTDAGGLYHEKLGVFRDRFGNVLAFAGSANETRAGYCDNYENIDVFRSWVPADAERVVSKGARFEALWEGQRSGVVTYSWSRHLAKMKEFASPGEIDDLPTSDAWDAPDGPGTASRRDVLKGPTPGGIPSDVELRSYQKNIIANWLQRVAAASEDGKGGVFKMATGTGKTVSALAAAGFLWRKAGLNIVVVVCPYRHLVEQWATEAQRFGFDPIKCMESSARWSEQAYPRILRALSSKADGAFLVTTAATLQLPIFQRLLSRVADARADLLVIGDEIHNYASGLANEVFPEFARYRLGLSATPERYMDSEGTTRILDYFGPVVAPVVGLKEALEAGVLCPYDYHPIFVYLDEEETDEYGRLSAEIGKALAGRTESDPASPPLLKLLLQRSRLLGRAGQKLEALRTWLRVKATSQQLHRTLIYTGDGSVEDSDGLVRYPEVVAATVREYGATSATFLSETERRTELLRSFAAGTTDVLVAIRCLDEGVDVPGTSMALIMASARDPRQSIQRRGRLLRKSPGKEYAQIYDMLVMPPDNGDVGERVARSLVRAELRRAFEFAHLARNRLQAEAAFIPFQSRYSLFDGFADSDNTIERDQ